MTTISESFPEGAENGLPVSIQTRIQSLSWSQFGRLVRALGMDVAEFAENQKPAERVTTFESQIVAYAITIKDVEAALPRGGSKKLRSGNCSWNANEVADVRRSLQILAGTY